MKKYTGQRAFDGLVVTVDGKPLPEHYEVKQFTTWGFEWTYEGESPQQLALAIQLYDSGTEIAVICSTLGISRATLYRAISRARTA